MNCSIRRADEKDLDIVLDFIYRLDCQDNLQNEFKADRNGLRALLFSPGPAGEAWIAEIHEIPVGVVVFSPILFVSDGCGSLYITKLFVVPESRNKGIGKALILHCVNLSRQRSLSKIVWGVNAQNTEGQKFYERIGAKEIAEARWFFMEAA